MSLLERKTSGCLLEGKGEDALLGKIDSKKDSVSILLCFLGWIY